MAGRLIVCPTPIGNLGDMTPRVRDALVDADLVACEDTRRTGLLFDRLDQHRCNTMVWSKWVTTEPSLHTTHE